MRMTFLSICMLAVVATSTARAQDAVYFADMNLKLAVEDALWISDPSSEDMLGLAELNAIGKGINDLTGLSSALNLQTLSLRDNSINDISPLSTLDNLKTINLSKNSISDLTPLSGLENLLYLDIHMNKISELSPLHGLRKLETLIIRFNELSDISAMSGLRNLKKTILRSNQIHDISPLGGLHRLEYLDLFNNEISDLSPLADLTNLEELHLYDSQDGDISPLSGLRNLRVLGLKGNGIKDISPLSDLTKLQKLMLHHNPIHDISALTKMSELRQLYLERTGLDNDARCSHLQTIADNNPGIYLVYNASSKAPEHVTASDQTYPDRVHITWDSVCNGPSFTSYYSVSRSDSAAGIKDQISEWQTSLHFDDMDAESGTQYSYWLKTATDENGFSAGDYSTPAIGSKGGSIETMDRLYVDDDAVNDSGVYDSAQSDPFENGTAEHPFDRIQEAIDVAVDGDGILVRPGTYYENIDFLGKQIELMGIAPNDLNAVDFPVIDGGGTGPVVSFAGGEDPNCLLIGFVITRGADDLASAILCQGSSPTIAHCLITGNSASDPNGAAIYCHDSNAVFAHCTIADNVAGANAAGIVMVDSSAVLTNSIVWGNVPAALILLGTSEALISFTDITHVAAPGNLDMDPLFAQPGYWAHPSDLSPVLELGHPDAVWIDGDYHLLSAAGRWHSVIQAWVQDAETSPCIDAGNPLDSLGREPTPNGDIINMGAYGRTAGGSKSN
jgi:hypothetical protein